MNLVYLNGDFLPADQAFVPVLDRGFIFGDGVYEVIPAYHGHLFRLHEHLARLQDSLQGIRLENPLNEGQWSAVLTELVQRNGGGDLSLYLQITRGPAKRDHALPANVKPTIFAMCSPMEPAPQELLSQGVAAITVADTRWQNCHIKAIALLPNILLRQQAVDAGAMEAILIRDSKVTEGAASNIFLVKNDTIVTPPKGRYLLPGITRDLVVELALQQDIPCEQRLIDESELAGADELWLTSSTKEILPVTRLNGNSVGAGTPGRLWRRMYGNYQEFKRNLATMDA